MKNKKIDCGNCQEEARGWDYCNSCDNKPKKNKWVININNDSLLGWMSCFLVFTGVWIAREFNMSKEKEIILSILCLCFSFCTSVINKKGNNGK